MTVDPHRRVVMRDWKGEDLPVEFLLPLHIFEEFDDNSDLDAHHPSDTDNSYAHPHSA